MSFQKIFISFFALFICAILVLFLIPVWIGMVGQREVPEMTPDRANKLFEAAGGVGKINSEAGWLFEHADTNQIFLFADDLTNTPAILSLYSVCKKYSGRDYSGTSVGIFPGDGRHMEIKFGNHWSLKRIYIFDPNTMAVSNLPIEWFQVASNIFVSR